MTNKLWQKIGEGNEIVALEGSRKAENQGRREGVLKEATKRRIE